MPTKTTAYKCSFKCGYVAIGEEWTIKHETNCSKNPKKKGCLTCKFFIHPTLYGDFSECEKDNLDYDHITTTNPSGLRYNCDIWELLK